MAKHTIATPCHSQKFRADNKILFLNYPQKPLMKTKYEPQFRFEDYPQGTNAVIAVISYTGNFSLSVSN